MAIARWALMARDARCRLTHEVTSRIGRAMFYEGPHALALALYAMRLLAHGAR